MRLDSDRHGPRMGLDLVCSVGLDITWHFGLGLGSALGVSHS